MLTAREPSWLRIVRHWGKLPGKTGPTLPFVFGATRVPAGRHSSSRSIACSDFDDLLMEMRRHEHLRGDYCAIRMCSVIRQPIITVERTEIYDTALWGGNGQDIDNLECSLGTLSSEESFTELRRQCIPHIFAGHYSLRNGIFQPFDSNDLSIITKALIDDERKERAR